MSFKASNIEYGGGGGGSLGCAVPKIDGFEARSGVGVTWPETRGFLLLPSVLLVLLLAAFVRTLSAWWIKL